MKVALILAIALVVLSSVPVKGFQDVVNAQASAGSGVSAQAGQNHATAGAPASADANLRPVQGELVGKIDSKSAKVGDEVVLKTTEKMETAEGTVIPKGSRLVGHITDVQAHGSGHANSSMSFAFDRADLKSGQTVALHSVIRSIAPPASVAASMESDDSLSTGPAAGSMAGGGHSMGGGRVGSGLVGAAGSTTAVTSNVADGTSNTAGGALRTAGDAGGSAAAGVGSGVRGAAGASAALGAQATAIPGVMLQSDASASTSGTLTASKHNVHLDAGTQFTLDVSAAATTMR